MDEIRESFGKEQVRRTRSMAEKAIDQMATEAHLATAALDEAQESDIRALSRRVKTLEDELSLTKARLKAETKLREDGAPRERKQSFFSGLALVIAVACLVSYLVLEFNDQTLMGALSSFASSVGFKTITGVIIP